MRRYLSRYSCSMLVSAMLLGSAALPVLAQSTPPTATRTAGSNVLDDELSDVINYLRTHYRGALITSRTLSGSAFSADAVAALEASGRVPRGALQAVRNDLVLGELVIQAAQAKFLGATNAAAVQTAVANRLASSAAAASTSTARDATWIAAKRGWNDQVGSAIGAREAVRAAGGIKAALSTLAAVQLLGRDTSLDDPAFVRDLQTMTPDRIIARQAAAGLGLPAEFANRNAQDLLRDAASLQLLGFNDFTDPHFQNDLRRLGWSEVIRRQANIGMGLPANANVGPDAASILRDGAAIQLLGGDASIAASYGVVQALGRGALTMDQARSRLATIAGAGGTTGSTSGSGSASGSGSSSGGGSQPSGSGVGGSGSGGAHPGGSGGEITPPPTGGSSSGGSQSNPSNSGASGGGASNPDSGAAAGGNANAGSSGAQSDPGWTISNINNNGDGTGSYTITIHNSDGSTETRTATVNADHSATVRDANGNVIFEAPAGSSAVPSESHEGEFVPASSGTDTDGDGNPDTAPMNDDSSDPGSDDNATGRMTDEQYYAQHGLFLGISATFITASAPGSLDPLIAGDFVFGDFASPLLDRVYFSFPVGAIIIGQMHNGDPLPDASPRPSGPPPAAPGPAADPNVINPGPDAPTGSVPVQIPIINQPSGPQPGVGAGTTGTPSSPSPAGGSSSSAGRVR